MNDASLRREGPEGKSTVDGRITVDCKTLLQWEDEHDKKEQDRDKLDRQLPEGKPRRGKGMEEDRRVWDSYMKGERCPS